MKKNDVYTQSVNESSLYICFFYLYDIQEKQPDCKTVLLLVTLLGIASDYTEYTKGILVSYVHLVDGQFRQWGYCQFSDSTDQILDQEEAFPRLKHPDKSARSWDQNPLGTKAVISLVFRCWGGLQWTLWRQDTDLPALSHSKPNGTSFLSGLTQRKVGGGGGRRGGGNSQEHRNGNACNTPRVIDNKTQSSARCPWNLLPKIHTCVASEATPAEAVCSDFCGGRGALHQ